MPAEHPLVRTIRHRFIAGLIILIPIVITVKVFWWLFNYLDGLSRPLSVGIVGKEVPGAGFVVMLAVVLLTGLLFSSGPLRRIFHGVEEVLENVPIVGTLYATIKKVLEGFGNPKARQAFQRFVFARLPGRTTPGFLMGTSILKRSDGTIESFCTVYVPTNHLYVGDVVVLPMDDVIETDLSVEGGMSVILSAGAAMPPEIVEKAATMIGS